MEIPLEHSGECPLVADQTTGLDDELAAGRSRPLRGRDDPAAVESHRRQCVIIEDRHTVGLEPRQFHGHSAVSGTDRSQRLACPI